MGALDDLLAEERKKKSFQINTISPTQQGNQSGSALDALLSETPTPSQQVQKSVQQPVHQQNNNPLQSAIESIKKVAESAISTVTQFIQGNSNSNITAPIPQNEVVNNPGNVTNQPPVKTPAQTFLDNFFPETVKTIKDLQMDPLSLQQDPKKAIGDAWDAIKNPVIDYIKTRESMFTPPKSLGEDLSRNLQSVTGAANIVFSPLTALFNAANDIPGVGSVSRLITLPYTAVGEGATDVSNKMVDSLPISQKTKDQIKPGIGQIFALAAQLALGKATEVAPEKIKLLTDKFGPTDAETIVNTAKNLADEKKAVEQKTNVTSPEEQANPQVTQPFQSTAQAVLPAPKEKYVSGEGFEMTDKANPQKVEVMKSINNYQKALDRYNKTPTPYNLKIVQKTRSVMEDLKNKGIVSPTVEKPATSQPSLSESTQNVSIDQNTNPTQIPSESVAPESAPASETVAVPRENLPVGEGDKRVSKLEARMKGVIGNATEDQIKDLGLSTYNKMNRDETIAKAAKYVSENPDEAIKVLKGEVQEPKDIPSEAIYVALSKVADNDITLATKLTSLRATAMGQRLGILAELDPNSPVKIMSDVVKVREAEAMKKYKGKSVNELTKTVVEQAKKYVKVPKKEDWAALLRAIEC